MKKYFCENSNISEKWNYIIFGGANVEIFKEDVFLNIKKETILIFCERKMKNLVKIFGNIFIIFQHQIFKIYINYLMGRKNVLKKWPCATQYLHYVAGLGS